MWGGFEAALRAAGPLSASDVSWKSEPGRHVVCSVGGGVERSPVGETAHGNDLCSALRGHMTLSVEPQGLRTWPSIVRGLPGLSPAVPDTWVLFSAVLTIQLLPPLPTQ